MLLGWKNYQSIHMGQFISSQKKATILSAVKDEGMGIINAAKKYQVSTKTIHRWLHQQTKNEHTSTAEVERLKRENQTLKVLLGEVVLNQQLKRKNTLLSS